jgi:hypothetical protein
LYFRSSPTFLFFTSDFPPAFFQMVFSAIPTVTQMRRYAGWCHTEQGAGTFVLHALRFSSRRHTPLAAINKAYCKRYILFGNYTRRNFKKDAYSILFMCVQLDLVSTTYSSGSLASSSNNSIICSL